jgi:hypothetical protein
MNAAGNFIGHFIDVIGFMSVIVIISIIIFSATIACCGCLTACFERDPLVKEISDLKLRLEKKELEKKLAMMD